MPIGTQEELERVLHGLFHRRRRADLRHLATAELMASLDTGVLASPDDDLRRILTYFGRLPIHDNLIVERGSATCWYVCRLNGSPPRRADRVAGPLPTQHDARRLIFTMRVAEILDVRTEGVDV